MSAKEMIYTRSWIFKDKPEPEPFTSNGCGIAKSVFAFAFFLKFHWKFFFKPSKGQDRKQGVLTIYKTHPVGNFRHKHKTIKCEVAGEGITIKYIHIS